MKEIDLGIVYHPDFLLHTNKHHPECKERLEAIMDRLKKEKVLSRLKELRPKGEATLEAIAQVHEEGYIQQVREACSSGVGRLDMDTYLTPNSFDIARLAVQGGLDAVKAVKSGELKRVFAFLRPPGHHAETNRGMGFCLFNNIAVAARFLQKEYGLERILVVDFDVHHGNGTQQAFEKEPGVLFFSVHQSPAYPGTGGINEIGKEEGVGFNINAPLPPGSGDEDYEKLFLEVLLPVAEAYKPQFLLVSAGQDAYAGDPLASMQVSLQGYGRIAELLMELAAKHTDGKAVFFLEGGYNLNGQAGAVFNMLNVMGNWNMPFLGNGEGGKGPSAVSRITEIMEVQKNFWPL